MKVDPLAAVAPDGNTTRTAADGHAGAAGAAPAQRTAAEPGATAPADAPPPAHHADTMAGGQSVGVPGSRAGTLGAALANPFEGGRRPSEESLASHRSSDTDFSWTPAVSVGSEEGHSAAPSEASAAAAAAPHERLSAHAAVGLPGAADAAGQVRLSHSLLALAQLETSGQEVRDIRIFHFLSHQDSHTVGDIRRAARWVAGHPEGVGRVSSQGLEGRWPDELDRLPKLAIALGLERLKLSGALGMPTFEHELTGGLMDRMRVHLEACLRHERLPLARLQEQLMRNLVGAEDAAPPPNLHALRLSVEELAVRPRHNQRDYVNMAIELALD